MSQRVEPSGTGGDGSVHASSSSSSSPPSSAVSIAMDYTVNLPDRSEVVSTGKDCPVYTVDALVDALGKAELTPDITELFDKMNVQIGDAEFTWKDCYDPKLNAIDHLDKIHHWHVPFYTATQGSSQQNHALSVECAFRLPSEALLPSDLPGVARKTSNTLVLFGPEKMGHNKIALQTGVLQSAHIVSYRNTTDANFEVHLEAVDAASQNYTKLCNPMGVCDQGAQNATVPCRTMAPTECTHANMLYQAPKTKGAISPESSRWRLVNLADLSDEQLKLQDVLFSNNYKVTVNVSHLWSVDPETPIDLPRPRTLLEYMLVAHAREILAHSFREPGRSLPTTQKVTGDSQECKHIIVDIRAVRDAAKQLYDTFGMHPCGLDWTAPVRLVLSPLRGETSLREWDINNARDPNPTRAAQIEVRVRLLLMPTQSNDSKPSAPTNALSENSKIKRAWLDANKAAASPAVAAKPSLKSASQNHTIPRFDDYQPPKVFSMPR
jgi:hypothetical protein